MDKIFSLLLMILILASCASKKEQSAASPAVLTQPNIAFEVTEGILHPESVLYSPEHKLIFVSNVASGNPVETKRVGYISKLSSEGKVIKSKWVKGLKAPKGLAIVGNFLYVSDVNQAVKIDIAKGRVVQTITVPGSKFLNDVVADKAGNIYISDMFTDTIYIWNNKGILPWVKSPLLRGPNGLYTDGLEHVISVSWGNPIDVKTFATTSLGAMSALSLKATNNEINEEATVRGNLDGIDIDSAGNLWISDWMNGDVYVAKKNGSAQKRFNFGQGTADISVAKELGLLLIPQMYQNKIIAVDLK